MRALADDSAERDPLRLASSGLAPPRLTGEATPRHMSAIFFKVLGPLEIVADGHLISLNGANQRAVLGFLLLNANKMVSTAGLVKALWGDDPPPTSRKMVQNSVSGLRRALAPHGVSGYTAEILTCSPGYLLRVPAERVDRCVFQQLALRAHGELAAGQPDQASQLVRQALALWRGSALADLADTGIVWPELTTMQNARLAAFEDYVQAELALGREQEVVGELEPMAEAEPARERLCGYLMLALYRCSRQRDALRAYQRTRLTLVERFGLDPGHELQELEQAILNHDPALMLPDAEPAGVADKPAGADGTVADSPTSHDTADNTADNTAPSVTELRWVSVLLIKAQRVTPRHESDPEYVDESLQAAAVAIGEEVERFGGAIRGVVGSLWWAVFGVPRSHEDDPERAFRAALAVLDKLVSGRADSPARTGAATLAVQAAVATGEVMATYEAENASDPVEMTSGVLARCQELLVGCPPGDVRVCENTRLAVGSGAGILASAGMPPERRATTLDPDPREPVRSTPFVGRGREVELLQGLLSDVHRRQRPHLVTVLGETGMGKSRLITEFERAARGNPGRVNWLAGPTSPFGEDVALQAASEIVRSHAGITEPDDAAERKLTEVVRGLVGSGDSFAWLLSGLRLLAGLGVEPTGQGDTTEMFTAWCRFLEEIATTCTTVVVLEDLHWASATMHDFVEDLADHLGAVPLLVVTTARPELLQLRPCWGGGNRNSSTLTLDPLSREATEHLMNSLALPAGRGNQQASGRWESRAPTFDPPLLARVGGNPLFAAEYVRLPRSGGKIASGPVPRTVRSVIAARLDNLLLCEKVALRDAAIFGETVWAGGLAALVNLEQEEAVQCLETLRRKGLLRRSRESSVVNDVEYRFRDVLIRDVAYAQLPRTERPDKHLRAATWISQLSSDHAELLAPHYALAVAHLGADSHAIGQVVDRARQVLTDAGRKAASAHSHRAAVSCYESVLDMYGPGDALLPQLLLLYGRSRQALDYAENLATRGQKAFPDQLTPRASSTAPCRDARPPKAAARSGSGC
jgi:DNA-binding SARP family transcriptional activator/class 3 adenylate cyclase